MLFLASIVVAGTGAWVVRWAWKGKLILSEPGSQWIIVGLTVAGAGLALLAPAAPTGSPALDALYRAAFACLVVLAASRARPWTWIIVSGVVVIIDHGHPVGLLGGAALAVALGSLPRTAPVLGAGVGLAVSEGLLEAHWTHPLGASAAAAAVILALLGVSCLAGLRRPTRRLVYAGTGSIVALASLAAAGYAAGAWSARTQARSGLNDAQAALAAVRAGSTGQAAAEIRAATTALGELQSRIGHWWDQPALAVPILAQNVRATSVAVTEGRDVLREGANLLAAAGARDFQIRNGTINLARVARLAPRLAATEAVLRDAADAIGGQRSPWVVAPLRHRLDRLTGKLRETRSADQTVTLAARTLPAILGGGGPRRWMLAILDNSELRGAGGLVTAVGEIDASSGHLTLESMEPVSALTEPAGGAHITGPREWLDRYGEFRPQLYLIDDVYSPDFPSDAEVLSQVYPQWGGRPVSGVIAVDPFGLADLLQITGPVTVPPWPGPITAANVVPILLHDEYTVLGGSGTVRTDFLVSLARQIYARLTSGSLPGPSLLARTLGAALPGHHIQLYSPRPADERLFSAIGASGAVPRVRADYLQVVTQNASNDKGDWFITRSTSYSVQYDPRDGVTTARLQVVIHNSVPASGEPPYVLGGLVTKPGYDSQWISVYTPLSLASVTALSAQSSTSYTRERELGLNVYSGWVTVPPGKSVSVTLNLYGIIPGGPAYRLTVGYQPAPHPDSLTVRMRDAGRSDATVWQGAQTSDKAFMLGTSS